MVNRRSFAAACLMLPAWPALAAATDADAPGWPTALLMATGRPGGAYSLYGPAWGALAEQEAKVAISYLASGGAATDILLIEQGAAQLGMTTVTVADQARSGSGAWTAGVKFQSFRALFPMFPSIVQIVAANGSGITALAELSGRRIGIGPDGGSGSAALPALLAGLAITPACCITGDYMPQIAQMLAGDLDACAFINAPPVPAIQATAQQRQLRLIGFTEQQAMQAAGAVPGMVAMVLPAGTFIDQTTPISSVGTANFAIGAARLPNALAAQLTIAAMQNRDKLATLVPAVAGSPKPMLAGQGEMTFHPGAASALRALGMDVPAKFIED